MYVFTKDCSRAFYSKDSQVSRQGPASRRSASLTSGNLGRLKRVNGLPVDTAASGDLKDLDLGGTSVVVTLPLCDVHAIVDRLKLIDARLKRSAAF